MIRRRRRVLAALGALAAVAGFAPVADAAADHAAACLGRSPLAAAKRFYAEHRDFAMADPARLAGRVTPRLYAALAFEHACPAGEVCALDADPWTAAQDGEIRPPIRYRLVAAQGERAEVEMIYRFVIDPARLAERTATIRLARGGDRDCWQVADLVAPDRSSLLGRIEAFRAQFGEAAAARPRGATR